jgi:hypothetical protein
MRVQFGDKHVAWADWAVLDEDVVVGLSLFGKPQDTEAICEALNKREVIVLSPVAAQGMHGHFAKFDTAGQGSYLQLHQAVIPDLDHRLFIHPNALLANAAQTSLTRFYLIGRQPLIKFGRFLERLEAVPFLPAWSAELYAYASERRWVRDLGGSTARVELPRPVLGTPSLIARRLSALLRRNALPVPVGYDFLARTLADKGLRQIEQHCDSERGETTTVEVEHFVAATCLLYFDGTLVQLDPMTEGTSGESGADPEWIQPQGESPQWLNRYERRPRKIASIREYLQTLVPQVELPEPLWQGEQRCRFLPLARRPFRAQQEAIDAVLRRFSVGGRAAALLAETGSGKSLMATAIAAGLAGEVYRRPCHVVVLAPPHLVQEEEGTGSQWREEIQNTLELRHRVIAVRSSADLETYRTAWQAGRVREKLVFFLVTPHVLRSSRTWEPSTLRFRRLGQERLAHLVGQRPARLPIDEQSAHPMPYLPAHWENLRVTLRRLWCANETDRLLTLASASPRLCSEILAADPHYPTHAAIARFIAATATRSNERGFAALWAARLALLRRETLSEELTYCPRCRERLTCSDTELQRSRLFHSCGEPLFSDVHRRDEEGGRRGRSGLVQWLVRNRFPVDLAIVDEAHQFKARDTAQAAAFRRLAAHARHTLAMTGTPSDGYASSLHFLLYALSPAFRRDFRFTEVTRFARTYGLWQRTTVVDAEGRRSVTWRERPGIHPQLLKRYVLEVGVPLLLSDFEDLTMPPLAQYQHLIAMEPAQAERVAAFSKEVQSALQRRHSDGWRLASSALQKQLVCPDLCFNSQTVLDTDGEPVAAFAPLGDLAGPDGTCLRLLPKEEAVFRLLARQKAQGRRVMVYVCHTGRHDYIARFLAASDCWNARENASLRIAGFYVSPPAGCSLYRPGDPSPTSNRDFILASTPQDRRHKLLAVAETADAVIINSRCVETGLNLREFPSLVFLEMPYSATNFRQSAARSWRPGQTRPVEVHVFVYRDSLQLAALRLVGAKLAYDNRVRGELSMGSLEADGMDGDLVYALSRLLRGEIALADFGGDPFDCWSDETVEALFRFEPVRGRRRKPVEGVYQGVLF